MTGERALAVALSLLRPAQRVLDVGAGNGAHVRRFLAAGMQVVALDMRPAAVKHDALRWAQVDLAAEWPDLGPFNLVWCSHVLEHLPDVGTALYQMRRALTPAGVLCVTVPPRKEAIVGGHVNLFNLGLLAYRLILAGFDCRLASFASYGYNLSAIVRRDQSVPARVLSSLAHDRGDIETLAPYFPDSWSVYQGFDGAAVPTCGAFA